MYRLLRERADRPDRRQRLRQLDQRERIARRLEEDTFARLGGEVRGGALEERPGRRVVERTERDVLQACPREGILAAVAHREHERDRVGAEAPGDEGEDFDSGAVEPV